MSVYIMYRQKILVHRWLVFQNTLTCHNLGNFHVKNIHVMNFNLIIFCGSRVTMKIFQHEIYKNSFKKIGLVYVIIHDELQA